VALFFDLEPEPPAHKRRKGWLGWFLLALALVGVAAVALIRAPYVIEQPGPVFNTLSTVTVDGKEVPLIEIPNETTYPTSGSLDMLTVSIRGNREQLPNWLEVVSAWMNPSMAVVPVDDIYPKGVTVQDSNKQSQVDMENSQKEAIAAALTNLGYTFSSTLTVSETQKGAPADGVLKAGDQIVSVNGEKFADVSALRSAIAANGTDSAATVGIVRDGVAKDVSITPVLSSGATPVPIVGIIVGSEYDFPIDVKIQLQNVGGPSAGMMFALGIIDKLTPDKLNGGKQVAGTGTITASGEVGPIGGIRQKMYAARDSGAKWFLAPADNCDEVTGHIPSGLTVFAVEKLSDSLTDLKAIASGASTSALSACPVQ
jgi:Lon-like protease